jgi:hypothetical protein
MASSRKSFRTLSALLAWLLACGLFIAFYFSDYARVPGKTVVETSSLSNPKSWVLALGFSLSRRFISDTSDPVFPKIILIFSLASLLLFLALSLFLWKRGLEKIVLLWAGVASFSMMGSLMIFLSRGSIVPAERHSPGSDGYWLSLIALGIHYLYVNHLSEWRQKGVSHQWLGLGSILFLISLWVLGIGRTLTSFKQNGDWRNPTFFSRSCIDATRSHPVFRDLAFRNCFMFGDERSTYQFALMRLGNMKTDHIKRPIYDDSKVKVFALLPSRLMAAFTDQYLFKVGPQAGQSLLGKRVYYSPAKEQPLMKLWPTPMTWHMDWNDLGGGKRTPTTIHTLNGVRDEVNKLDPQSDSVLLIAAKEMEPEVKAVVSLLSKAGFVELPNRSLAQSNRQFPSLRAICFAGRRPDQSIGRVHPCNGPALVEIPAPTANSNPI